MWRQCRRLLNVTAFVLIGRLYDISGAETRLDDQTRPRGWAKKGHSYMIVWHGTVKTSQKSVMANIMQTRLSTVIHRIIWRIEKQKRYRNASAFFTVSSPPIVFGERLLLTAITRWSSGYYVSEKRYSNVAWVWINTVHHIALSVISQRRPKQSPRFSAGKDTWKSNFSALYRCIKMLLS